MTSIQLYSNQEFSVRSVTDTDGTVWFVAKDIAEALEYTLDGGIGKYFAHVPDCWKGGKRIATPWRRTRNALSYRARSLFLLGAK